MPTLQKTRKVSSKQPNNKLKKQKIQKQTNSKLVKGNKQQKSENP